MLEITGDIFEEIGRSNALCITTNGIVKKNGRAVCGRGIALEARNRWPDFDIRLGALLQGGNNVPYVVLHEKDTAIVNFPTKDHWRYDSRIDIIKKSAILMVDMADMMEWKRIVLPRPGCNNGGLYWEEVKKELEGILDDRFIVYERGLLDE
jgi:hypothetical protein